MTETSAPARSRSPWLTVDRLGAFTDGVIAIIITILVLEIGVPEDHDFGEEGVLALFHDVYRDVMVYFVSFGLIGAFWLQHHVLFHYLARADRGLIFLNQLFVLLLSLAPFSTQVAGAYPDVPIAEFAFGINFLLSSLAFVGMWQYVSRNDHLLKRPVDEGVLRSMRNRVLLLPATILLGMLVSLLDFHVAAVIYLAAPLIYLSHRDADMGWQSAES